MRNEAADRPQEELSAAECLRHAANKANKTSHGIQGIVMISLNVCI